MTTYLNYNMLNIYTSTASDTFVDYVWVKKGHPTANEVATINNFYFKPQRDDNTLLLANFDGTLNGGDIQNIDSPILNWNIYKREDNSPILKYVVSLPVDQNSFIDYNIKYGHNYRYEIFAETATALSEPFTNPEAITAFWQGWMLIDLLDPVDEICILLINQMCGCSRRIFQVKSLYRISTNIHMRILLVSLKYPQVERIIYQAV